ncbi:MAG: phytoene desaturase family protein, partial [Candidatus Binatia bacterium]
MTASSGADRDRADVVVVGGGHNGLTAACYLAKLGWRVVVVERLNEIGGMTHSSYAIPEAPQHLVHTGAVEVIFLRATAIVEDLALAAHGWRTVDPDPSYVHLHPDGASLAFWRDPAKTADEIRRYSADDARAYLELVELLDALLRVALPLMRTEATRPDWRELGRAARALLRGRRMMGELVGLVTGSADQAVLERFEHPVVQSALLGLAGGAGPIDRDGSGLALMLVG